MLRKLTAGLALSLPFVFICWIVTFNEYVLVLLILSGAAMLFLLDEEGRDAEPPAKCDNDPDH